MFLVNTVPSGRVIAVYSRLRSLKFAYVSSGSHDLAGQVSFFLAFFFFCSSNFSRFFLIPYYSFTFMIKNLPDKDNRKRLRRRLSSMKIGVKKFLFWTLRFYKGGTVIRNTVHVLEISYILRLPHAKVIEITRHDTCTFSVSIVHTCLLGMIMPVWCRRLLCYNRLCSSSC